MKFLIVDDHPLFREALEKVLARIDSDAECVGANGCREAEALLKGQSDSFDLVLLDIVMPCAEGGNGTDFLARMAIDYPELPVVMLSASESLDHMRCAFDLGAIGYIPKSQPTEVMIGALQLVLAGGVYVPPHMVTALAGDESVAATAEGEVHLTPRQRDVAHLLREGRTNKEIARELALSPETVKAHLAAIFRVLNVRNRTTAVMALERQGL